MAPRQVGDAAERRRPYLIVSAFPWNQNAAYPRLTGCPLTGVENVPHRYETDVPLRARDTGLPKNSVVRCVEVYTFFRELLLARAGAVPGRTMDAVDRALRTYLALDRDPEG